MSPSASKKVAQCVEEKEAKTTPPLKVPRHPLFIAEILRMVFTYLSMGQWPILRRVCRAWDEEIQRHKKNYNFISARVRDNSWKNIPGDTGNLMKHMLPIPDTKAMLKEHFFPFMNAGNINYEGNYSKCVKVYGFTMDDCIQLGNVCGYWLKRMHLIGCYIGDADVLRVLLFEKTPNLVEFESILCSFDVGTEDDLSPIEYTPPLNVQKQLVSMKIVKSAKIRAGNRSYDFPINVMRLLSFFPGILNLHLSCMYNPLVFNQIIEVISKIRIATGKNTLNLLSLKVESDPYICNKFTSEIIEKFGALALPIKSLAGFLGPSVTNYDMSRLTQAHHVTLQELSLKRTFGFYYFDYDFLPENLTKLVLSGRVDTWSFLPKMKNLKTLMVYPDPIFNADPDDFLNECPTLEKLEAFHFYGRDPVNRNMLMECTRTMPNLIELHIVVRPTGFTLICNTWERLEKYSGNLPNIKERIFVKNVIKLQRLRKFSLFASSAVQFGNFSINNGFLKLPELDSVKINLKSTVSREAVNRLNERVGSTCYYNRNFASIRNRNR